MPGIEDPEEDGSFHCGQHAFHVEEQGRVTARMSARPKAADPQRHVRMPRPRSGFSLLAPTRSVHFDFGFQRPAGTA